MATFSATVIAVDEAEVLMDEGDRQRLGAGATARPSRRISPASARVDAGENLDQRRLAGAVLAEQRMDLAATDVEIDRVERQRAGEALGQAGDREQRRRSALVMRSSGGSSRAIATSRSPSLGIRRRDSDSAVVVSPVARQPFTPQISR